MLEYICDFRTDIMLEGRDGGVMDEAVMDEAVMDAMLPLKPNKKIGCLSDVVGAVDR